MSVHDKLSPVVKIYRRHWHMRSSGASHKDYRLVVNKLWSVEVNVRLCLFVLLYCITLLPTVASDHLE